MKQDVHGKQTQLQTLNGGIKGKLREMGNKAKECVTNLTQRGILLVKETARRTKPFFRNLRLSLGSAFQNVVDYVSPKAEKGSERDQSYAATAALSVVAVIEGPEPIDAFCDMDPQMQEVAIRMIHENYSRMLGIPVCELAFVDNMSENSMGCYSYSYNCMLINGNLFTHPMTRERAKMLISTLIHETFHAFQYAAMMKPDHYKVPRDVARLWRQNAAHYITYEQNPIGYQLQPLETYAQFVEERAMQLLEDHDSVKKLESLLESMKNGGEENGMD